MEIIMFILIIFGIAFILGTYKRVEIDITRNNLNRIVKEISDSGNILPKEVMNGLLKRALELQKELEVNDYRSFNTSNKEDRKIGYATRTKEINIRANSLRKELNEVVEKFR